MDKNLIEAIAQANNKAALNYIIAGEKITRHLFDKAITQGMQKVLDYVIEHKLLDLNAEYADYVNTAINSNNQDFAIKLLENGSKITKYSFNYAIKMGMQKVLDYVIAHKLLDLNAEYADYVDTAINSNNEDFAMKLLENGSKIAKYSFNYAIKNGMQKVLDYVIAHKLLDLNAEYADYVDTAINSNKEDFAMKLLENGAKITASSFNDAIKNDFEQFVDYALDNKLVSIDQFKNYDVIKTAYANDSSNIASKLFDFGFKFKFSTISRLLEIGNEAGFNDLIAKQPDLLLSKDEGGNSILHFSASPKASIAMMKYLIAKTLNINEQNAKGDTSLHLSVCPDYYEPAIKIALALPAQKEFANINKNQDKALAIPTTQVVVNKQAMAIAHAFTKESEASVYLSKYGYAIYPAIKDDSTSYKQISDGKTQATVNELYKVEIASSIETKSSNAFSFASFKAQFEFRKSNSATSFEKIGALLQAGANPDIKNDMGLTAQDIVGNFCPEFLEQYVELIAQTPVYSEL
jgi:hypothetical protein